jgi:hypothetical protein
MADPIFPVFAADVFVFVPSLDCLLFLLRDRGTIFAGDPEVFGFRHVFEGLEICFRYVEKIDLILVRIAPDVQKIVQVDRLRH